MSNSTSARIETAFSQRLGVKHPIILAPMAGVAGGALAAAVSRAGGLGLIGGGYGDADFLEAQFDRAEDAAVGVGFISWSLAQRPSLLDAALSRRPVAVLLSFGDVTPYARKIKAAGSVLIVQVQSLEAAVKAREDGADIVVAQGTEAGGHGASRTIFSLLPAAVDALKDTPVIAAGGVADGRGLAAALTLGAAGALIGSRFYASEESLAPTQAKQEAVRASGDHTIRSSVFDTLRGLQWPAGYNLRSLKNDSTDRWHDNPEALERSLESAQRSFSRAVQDRDYRLAPVIVGEAVDLIRDVQSAQSIVDRLVAQAVESLRNPVNYSLLNCPD